MSRHPQRPHTIDYIKNLFDEFDELHGDRHFGDDGAIVGGVARLNGKPIMVIGEEKGRGVSEKVLRNFGMPKAEGYRKALRLMETAERFKMPVLTLIDTPGAYPGIDSEERNISEAIAKNLAVMSRLKTPINFNYNWRRWFRWSSCFCYSRQITYVRAFCLFCYFSRGLRFNSMEKS